MEEIEQGSLLLAASTDLLIWGQENVTIVCAVKTVIDIEAASNITISGIQFQNCRRVLVTISRLIYTTVEVANSNFTASHLRMSGANSETFVIVMKSIYFIDGALTLTKAHYVDVAGQSSSISCVNSKLNVYVLAPGVNISNIKFQGCNNINVRLKSRRVPIEIYSAWFSNSCLNFHANKTKSDILITMKMTKFEQCSCKSVQFFNKISASVTITIDRVIVRDNLLSFIESEGNLPVSVVVIEYCIFHRNKKFILQLNSDFILFSKAEVIFIDNMVDASAVQGAPIRAKSSSITFERALSHLGRIKVHSVEEL